MAETMTSAKVRKVLRDAGIPDEAIATTLANQKYPAVREHIIKHADRARRTEAARSYPGVYMYPKQMKNVGSARRVFYVAAKEMILSGTSSYCLSLTRLSSAINSDENNLDYSRMGSCFAVFITDFYESGAEPPCVGWQAATVRSWIKRKVEEGGTVCLLGDTALQDTTPWWPASFTGFLSENTNSFSIS